MNVIASNKAYKEAWLSPLFIGHSKVALKMIQASASTINIYWRIASDTWTSLALTFYELSIRQVDRQIWVVIELLNNY